MSDREPLDPLPPPLREEARRLRSLEPSPAFRERLSQALRDADAAAPAQQADAGARKPAGTRLSSDGLRGWTRLAALFMPILATAGLLLHYLLLREGLEQQKVLRYHAIDVMVDGAAPAWLDLGLISHHHQGRDATLRIQAPSEVTIVPTSHSTSQDESPSCDAGQCTYNFHQPAAHPSRAPLQIGVRSPGRYTIRIEHVSKVAHVQEEILVEARPDAASGREF